MNEDKFPSTRKPSHQRVYREFWKLSGKHKQEKKKNKKQKPQNTCLTTTHSGEVARMLASTTSERGLNRKAWVAHLK